MRSRCQKAIAAQISEQEADYVLALKGNHGNLHQAVKDYFYWAERQQAGAIELDEYRTIEKGHGRIEERRVVVTEDIDWMRWSSFLGHKTHACSFLFDFQFRLKF